MAGDRSRVILIPGNHDIDWSKALSSFQVVNRKDYPKNLAAALYHENSEYRWDLEILDSVPDPRRDKVTAS